MIQTRRLASLLAVAVLAACGDSSGPDAKAPGIHVLAGAGQTDTVDVQLPQALTVEVRDTTGQLIPGLIVRFDAAPDTAQVGLAPLAGQFFTNFVADTTDAQGQAAVLVRLGYKAGTARVFVSVASFGWVDTTSFTVHAGAAFDVVGQPADTTISIGASFQLRTAVADRHGNARTDPVTFQAVGGVVTVSSAGVVTAQTAGTARILATAAGLPPDTSRVGVVPGGTIAATTNGGLEIINLDGTGYQFLPIATSDYQGRYPTWLSQTAIAAMDGRYYADVLRVTTSGTVQYLVPTADSVVLEVWPQAARDGQWIYFGGLVPGYSTAGISIWRVSPNGATIQRVSPPNVDGQGDTYPSPSPDGTRVVVATTRFGGFVLAMINLSTKTLTNMSVAGLAPRWAPSGETIAYLGGPSGAEIWTVSSTGTNAHRVSPAGRGYAPGMDWSPDQKWIIAQGPSGLELVEVATGALISLPGLQGSPTQPSWKP